MIQAVMNNDGDLHAAMSHWLTMTIMICENRRFTHAKLKRLQVSQHNFDFDEHWNLKEGIILDRLLSLYFSIENLCQDLEINFDFDEWEGKISWTLALNTGWPSEILVIPEKLILEGLTLRGVFRRRQTSGQSTQASEAVTMWGLWGGKLPTQVIFLLALISTSTCTVTDLRG